LDVEEEDNKHYLLVAYWDNMRQMLDVNAIVIMDETFAAAAAVVVAAIEELVISMDHQMDLQILVP
jgi:hypothetical protein